MAVKEQDKTERWDIPSFEEVEKQRKKRGMDEVTLSQRAGLARGRYSIILCEMPDSDPYMSTVRGLYKVVYDNFNEFNFPTPEEMYHTCGDLSLCPRVISEQAGHHPRTFENDVKNDVDPHLSTYRTLLVEIINADPSDHPSNTSYGIDEEKSRMSDIIGSEDITPEDLGLSPMGSR
jgi:predicted transcriptional regulator